MRIKVHEKQETELSKLAKAYVKAVSGEDAVPDTVTMVSKTPIDDDGSVLIEFEFTGNGPKSTGGTTYALVYGDLYRNRDNDLLYFLHDWQSGEKVTPEDIGEHDWELANDYIRPSDILSEAFGGVDDMLSKEQQGVAKEAFRKTEAAQYRVSVNFTPEPPFGYGDQNFLFKGLDIVDEEFSFPSEKEAEDFAMDCANRMTARNQDLESDGLQDGEIRVYFTNQDTVDRMVRNAGKAYTALMDKPAFPVLVARISITKE